MSAWTHSPETLASTLAIRSSGGTASIGCCIGDSTQEQSTGQQTHHAPPELKQEEQSGGPSVPLRATCGRSTIGRDLARASRSPSPCPWQEQNGDPKSILKRKSTQAPCDDSKSAAGSAGAVDAIEALRDVHAWLSDAGELLERVLQAAGAGVSEAGDDCDDSTSEEGGAMEGEDVDL